MHLLQIGKMTNINNSDLKKMMKDYPYFYLPYMLKLSNLKADEFKKNLNSLSLRHPNRLFLKSFIDEFILNENIIIDDFI